MDTENSVHVIPCGPGWWAEFTIPEGATYDPIIGWLVDVDQEKNKDPIVAVFPLIIDGENTGLIATGISNYHRTIFEPDRMERFDAD